VEYDDKKGLKDHSPSNNNGNILSGLNSPSNYHQQQQPQLMTTSSITTHQKSMKLSNKQQHKNPANPEENKFLSPTITKKTKTQASQDKFKLRSLTMKEMDDSEGEEKQTPSHDDKNVSTNNHALMTSSISPSMKKPEQVNNLLDVSNRMPRSPMISGRLKRAKTTLEAENSVINTSKLDVTKDEQGNKKLNNYLMIKDLGRY
jgi:hypothetical protein